VQQGWASLATHCRIFKFDSTPNVSGRDSIRQHFSALDQLFIKTRARQDLLNAQELSGFFETLRDFKPNKPATLSSFAK
jgi:hypothetical protein